MPPEETKKAPRGGKVGAALDFLEDIEMVESDTFLVRRFLRKHAQEGGISERQELDILYKLEAKYREKAKKTEKLARPSDAASE